MIMLDSNKINIGAFKVALKKREARNNLLILIVEDQKFSRLLLKNHLSKTYDVIETSQGEEGLIEYIQNAPDIVFLDIELPGINGHKIAEYISKLDKEAYIIMVTANNDHHDVIKSKENNSKGFIIKPYNKERIYKSIEEFLTKHALKEFIK